ncbi:MAG: thioesterase family protein [Proteobacteria bacterium]|jgi:acyl-CoA thioester hydrolase|nr:thioesterase family protein [Pseudomonadota bacterium]
MKSIATEYRVTFSDTDAMGVVYYANYFEWFEIGRTEFFRSLGIPYKELDARGFVTPVVEAYCKFIKPARYDEILLIDTRVSVFKRATIRFEYSVIQKKDGLKLAEGYTVHAFLNKEDGKIVRIPEYIVDALKKLIE